MSPLAVCSVGGALPPAIGICRDIQRAEALRFHLQEIRQFPDLREHCPLTYRLSIINCKQRLPLLMLKSNSSFEGLFYSIFDFIVNL